MENLGLSLTPVAIAVSAGEIQRAMTIPSLHQLEIALGVVDSQVKGVIR